MPISDTEKARHKSAKKRDAISKQRRLYNQAIKSRLHTADRTFREIVAAGDVAKFEEAFRAFSSEVDKAAHKGAITKNGAARRKSRAGALIKKTA